MEETIVHLLRTYEGKRDGSSLNLARISQGEQDVEEVRYLKLVANVRRTHNQSGDDNEKRNDGTSSQWTIDNLHRMHWADFPDSIVAPENVFDPKDFDLNRRVQNVFMVSQNHHVPGKRFAQRR